MNQCVTLISPDDSVLVAKCCRLITNLIDGQKLIIEGRTLTLTVDWCLQALKQTHIDVDVLLALHAILASEANNISDAVDRVLAGNNNRIVVLAQEKKIEERVLLAVQCLVVCTAKKLTQNQIELASGIFTKCLTSDFGEDEQLLRAKLLGASLKGLQNIVEQSENYTHVALGILLGIAKSYMVFGLRGVCFIVPQKVLPSVLSVPEPSGSIPREKKGGKVM